MLRVDCKDLMDELLKTRVEIVQLKTDLQISLRKIEENIGAKEESPSLKIPKRKEHSIYHNNYETGYVDGFNACIEEIGYSKSSKHEL